MIPCDIDQAHTTPKHQRRPHRGDNVRETTSARRRAPFLFIALLTLMALVVAACGGSDKTTDTPDSTNPTDSGKPVSGGTITYSLEGNTTAFCPPGGQWAISGILIASAIYDTLTQPTDDPNVYAPYLAKSVEPNADYTEWTIVNRSGVTFHDGTPLTAEIVTQPPHIFWQAGFGTLDSVLRLNRRHVQIGARFKRQRNAAAPQFRSGIHIA